MLSVTRRAKQAAAKLWPPIAARCQQGWQWLVELRDPITWTVLRARLTTLPLLPSSNAGRCAVLVGIIVLLLLVLPWYAKGHKNKTGVVTFPNATLVNPILAGIGAALLIYAAIRQAQTASNRHEAQTDADRQRRITENFGTAVEQLASEHIEVRLGGIYALERISQESPRDYWAVMETLTAFVRERTQRTEAERIARPREQRLNERAYELWEQSGRPDGRSYEFWTLAGALENYGIPPATDIVAVLTVIKRRRDEDRTREVRDKRTLDFEKADLRSADFVEAPLGRTNFFRARLEGANFSKAHIEGASFVFSRLQNTAFFAAHLEGADFTLAEGLTQWQIDFAIGDDRTKLPEGLSLPAHWTDPKLRPLAITGTPAA